MIEQVHIENFKSIYNLEITTGRINLFIGENGSGKSNLLEALVFASANQSNKLDNEFLVSRGLRVPSPELMRSAFSEEDKDKSIHISLFKDNKVMNFDFFHDNLEYSNWMEGTDKSILDELEKENDFKSLKKSLYEDFIKTLENKEFELSTSKEIKKTIDFTLDANSAKNKIKEFIEKKTFSKYKDRILGRPNIEELKNFIIYSPENTALRTFEKEGQIQPLGINGEGLLKLLKVINAYEDKSYIETIIKSLQLFDWFEEIQIPDTLSSGEDKVIITDRYLYQEIDQRSTNEGFLFILFYITLLVAKETPKAFAIDNIDASLNPKLCTKLMLLITELAQKYDKQVFLTTHNPAILDGMNLNDEKQKLFVVSRNKSGYTRMKNITVKNKPKSSNDEPLKLSEAFLRGYLGGLPKGF